MIDTTASAVNTAKGILMTLDKGSIETRVQTETLRWLLTTLVELGSHVPNIHDPSTRRPERSVADNAARTVLGSITAVQEAEKSRGWG